MKQKSYRLIMALCKEIKGKNQRNEFFSRLGVEVDEGVELDDEAFKNKLEEHFDLVCQLFLDADD